MSNNKILTMNSKVGELYNTPIGNDIFNKLLLSINKSEKLITNPFVSNLKIKTVARLAKKVVSPSFFDSFLKLVNTEKDVPVKYDGEIKKEWWKEAVIYQIYPRTFCDSNNDETGDLRGIINKLDYLKDLGVDALWLSPIYDSPMDDNGYDIRDYRKINSDFGTMADFDELLDGVHKRGMHLIMDLVVNHTSDEHEWFQKALKDKKSKYHNYYIFRDKTNNWSSFFSGSAWNKYDDEYALHLFSKKQMDLNWECSDMRKDVIDMINWWLDKGVDGFRMDVINMISKQDGLPDGDPMIGKMMGVTGIENYFYGPHLHEYLKQIHDESFAPHKAFSVGEAPGLGMQMAKLVTADQRGELNMIFSFDHLEDRGKQRFQDYEYDLNYLKDYFIEWQTKYGNNCWPSVFYNNHDNPKMVSKVTMDKTYHKAIEKLLAVLQFTIKGTPFMFQGDEMGICNYEFAKIEDINDLESRNLYNELIKEKSPEEAMNIIRAGSREHGRILLPWNESSKNPIVHQQKADEEIFETYKQLIKMRHEEKTLVYGDFSVMRKEKDVFSYIRRDDKHVFIIDCNLSSNEKKALKVGDEFKLVFASDKNNAAKSKLGPYEARIYQA